MVSYISSCSNGVYNVIVGAQYPYKNNRQSASNSFVIPLSKSGQPRAPGRLGRPRAMKNTRGLKQQRYLTIFMSLDPLSLSVSLPSSFVFISLSLPNLRPMAIMISRSVSLHADLILRASPSSPSCFSL